MADTRYSQKFLDPIEWIETAEALREAATPFASLLDRLLSAWTHDHLAEDSGVLYKKIHVFYMLWAYCFENLLKAIIVKRELAEDIGEREALRLPKVLKTHNLARLADRAGVKYLVEDFPDVLTKLTNCSRWFGRYPVPLEANDLEKDYVDIRSVTNVHVRDLEIIYTSMRSALDRF